jgi:2-methylcitrate dehydratase PrpD
MAILHSQLCLREVVCERVAIGVAAGVTSMLGSPNAQVCSATAFAVWQAAPLLLLLR